MDCVRQSSWKSTQDVCLIVFTYQRQFFFFMFLSHFLKWFLLFHLEKCISTFIDIKLKHWAQSQIPVTAVKIFILNSVEYIIEKQNRQSEESEEIVKKHDTLCGFILTWINVFIGRNVARASSLCSASASLKVSTRCNVSLFRIVLVPSCSELCHFPSLFHCLSAHSWPWTPEIHLFKVRKHTALLCFCHF